MLYEYRTVETHTDDGQCVYQIALYMNGKRLCTLPDSSPDQAQMERIAAICTREQVEPIHVQDVMYDMTH